MWELIRTIKEEVGLVTSQITATKKMLPDYLKINSSDQHAVLLHQKVKRPHETFFGSNEQEQPAPIHILLHFVEDT